MELVQGLIQLTELVHAALESRYATIVLAS